jgi:hypothetical protein
MISKILPGQHRRVLSRQKATIYLAAFVILLYLFFRRGQKAQLQVWRQAIDLSSTILNSAASVDNPGEEIQWTPAPTFDVNAPQLTEDDMKELFKQEYNDLGK